MRPWVAVEVQINNHARYLFNLRSNADFASPRLRPWQGRRKATWASPPACRAVQSERRHPRLAGPLLLSSELAERLRPDTNFTNHIEMQVDQNLLSQKTIC